MAVIFTFANSIYKVTDHGHCYIPLDVVKDTSDFSSKGQSLTCFLVSTAVICRLLLCVVRQVLN